MFTGWKAFLGKPFALQRPLEIDENYNALTRDKRQPVPAHEWSSLLRLNSTYAEFVDRRYRLRGMIYTVAGLLGLALIGLTSAWLVGVTTIDVIAGSITGGELLFGIFVTIVPGFLLTVAIWHMALRYELFRNTHYPIRFNRKERMIYVFRGPEDGGVLEVPWDEAFFHIGTGGNHPFVRDLRCHVMQDGMVTDTFTVGHYFDDTQLDRVRSLWEFIRLYMEEGPQAVGPDPLDRYVSSSTNETLRNSYVHVAASLGAFAYRIRYLLFPIYLVLTLSRWLVLKTCKKPVWPAHIEQKCRIEPNDPHRWKEPSFHGEFANDPVIYERRLERVGPFLRR